MKKALIALVICLTFGLTAAFAGGAGDALYAKKCAGCHGADGTKTSGASGGTTLKGQSATMVKMKLTGYLDGSYGGKKAKTMKRVASKYTEQQLSDLAETISKF